VSDSTTNAASQEAIKAIISDSVVAMQSWMEHGTVPADYLRRHLGDPAQGVTVPVSPRPAPPQAKEATP
jgi:hypothetical protein